MPLSEPSPAVIKDNDDSTYPAELVPVVKVWPGSPAAMTALVVGIVIQAIGKGLVAHSAQLGNII